MKNLKSPMGIKYKLRYFILPFIIYGLYYVGTRLEFEDPFLPTPILKGTTMAPKEREANPLKAMSLTQDATTMLYKTLGDLVHLLEAEGIDYWISCGTLLGAVRHQGLIPYDDDVDLFIHEKDGPKVLALKDRLKAMGLGIAQDRTSIKVYKLNGVHVRPKKNSFKLFPGVWFVRRKQEKFPFIDLYISKIDQGDYIHAHPRAYRVFSNERFKVSDLYPLKRYQFGPLQLLGPNNPTYHLDRAYGTDWNEYLVFTSNHSTLNNKVAFKIPFEGPIEAYCYQYGMHG